jgi:hypothetical protein
MKMTRRFAQIQILLLSLLSSTAVPMAVHADEVRGALTLASETHWGDAILPPGYYTFTLSTRTAMPVVLLRSASGDVARFIVASSESTTREKSPNALTIEKIGRTSVVMALHVNDEGLILHFATPETASAIAAKTAEPKLTAYAAGKK